VLACVNLDVARGELVAIRGAAGSGKTTLLLCVAGLLRPDAGSIRWSGALRPAASTWLFDQPPGTDRLRSAVAKAANDDGLLLIDDVPAAGSDGYAEELWSVLDEARERGCAVLACVRDAPPAELRARVLTLDGGILSAGRTHAARARRSSTARVLTRIA
jgi:ABC-type Mn2+/Zn2+ transport system ATPase subunit